MVLYGLNENLRSYKSLKKGANFRLSPALNRHEFFVYVLQNAANCIRASLDFQTFPEEDTPGTPTRKLLLVLVNKDIYSCRT